MNMIFADVLSRSVKKLIGDSNSSWQVFQTFRSRKLVYFNRLPEIDLWAWLSRSCGVTACFYLKYIHQILVTLVPKKSLSILEKQPIVYLILDKTS